MSYGETFTLHPGPPRVHPTAFVAPSADLTGDVEIGPRSSVWYQCVLRGDINRVSVGEGSNIQDGVVIHVANDFPALLGNHVSVGHRAIVHACSIGDEVLIGMGAIVMDGSVIGPRSIIAAGALVTKNTRIPEGSLVMGFPASVVRPLTAEELSEPLALARKYMKLAQEYR